MFRFISVIREHRLDLQIINGCGVWVRGDDYVKSRSKLTGEQHRTKFKRDYNLYYIDRRTTEF